MLRHLLVAANIIIITSCGNADHWGGQDDSPITILGVNWSMTAREIVSELEGRGFECIEPYGDYSFCQTEPFEKSPTYNEGLWSNEFVLGDATKIWSVGNYHRIEFDCSAINTCRTKPEDIAELLSDHLGLEYEVLPRETGLGEYMFTDPYGQNLHVNGRDLHLFGPIGPIGELTKPKFE